MGNETGFATGIGAALVLVLTSATLLAVSACATLHYQIRAAGNDVVLVPPRVAAGAQVADGRFRIPFRGMANRSECGFATDAFSARAEPNALVLTTHYEKTQMAALPVAQSTPGASVRVAAGTPIAADEALAALRTRVEAMEAAGCFPRKQTIDPLARIIQSLPLESNDLVKLSFGDTLTNGYVDIVAGDQLQVITPLLDSSQAVAGRAVLWYVVQAQGDGEVEIRLSDPGALTQRSGGQRLRAQALPFSQRPVARYWRMAILSMTAGADRIETNELIAAQTIGALADATSRVLAHPGECAAIAGDAWCTAPKYGTVIHLPKTGVWVRGRWVSVPRGATVAQALALAGAPHPAPGAVRVLRGYGGRFIPVQRSADNGMILRLRLLGGERISY